jgi:hypothetical protein
MGRPDFEQYIKRGDKLVVRQPQVLLVPGEGITTRILAREGDPYDWRKYDDLKDKMPPSSEPPQELAQNE